MEIQYEIQERKKARQLTARWVVGYWGKDTFGTESFVIVGQGPTQQKAVENAKVFPVQK